MPVRLNGAKKGIDAGIADVAAILKRAGSDERAATFSAGEVAMVSEAKVSTAASIRGAAAKTDRSIKAVPLGIDMLFCQGGCGDDEVGGAVVRILKNIMAGEFHLSFADERFAETSGILTF